MINVACHSFVTMRLPAVVLSVLCLIFIIYCVCAHPQKSDPNCCVAYCYAEDDLRPQNIRMSTKTAYQLVKGRDRVKTPSNCTATKFWLLSRHGTRLPSAKHIDHLRKLTEFQSEIIENYSKGRGPSVGALCEADLKLMEDWKWDSNITEDIGDYLTVQGWNDLKGLAHNYKATYPALFKDYSAQDYIFQHSNTQRTEARYKAFVDGLFGNGAHERIPHPWCQSQIRS